MMKVAQNTPRILYYHGFENIIKTAPVVDVFNIISNSVQYKTLKLDVNNKVMNDFQQV